MTARRPNSGYPGTTPALGLAFLVVILLILSAGTSRAQPIVADITDHSIEITAGFVGADVTLFGRTLGTGDVIVVLRGPETTKVVRRKDRVLGIWVNQDSIAFDKVPSYFHIASTSPLAEILPDEIRDQLELGARFLKLPITEDTPIADARRSRFRGALFRNMRRAGLFGSGEGEIRFVGAGLFRLDLSFPANVPTGTYLVQVLYIENQEVVAYEKTPLEVVKVGIGARIFHFAHTYPGAYGIVAIALAVFFGWLAGVVFRKN